MWYWYWYWYWLHGQNCVVNENCLYKAILKIKNFFLRENVFCHSRTGTERWMTCLANIVTLFRCSLICLSVWLSTISLMLGIGKSVPRDQKRINISINLRLLELTYCVTHTCPWFLLGSLATQHWMLLKVKRKLSW